MVTEIQKIFQTKVRVKTISFLSRLRLFRRASMICSAHKIPSYAIYSRVRRFKKIGRDDDNG